MKNQLVLKLEANLNWYKSKVKSKDDPDFKRHLLDRVLQAEACLEGAKESCDNVQAYYLAAYRYYFKNWHKLPPANPEREPDIVVKEFNDANFFTEANARLLQALQAQYGSDMTVLTSSYLPPAGKDGVEKPRHYSFKVIITHKDFMPTIEELNHRGKPEDLFHDMTVFGTRGDYVFMVYGKSESLSLIESVRYLGRHSPNVDEAIDQALGRPKMWENILYVPLWSTAMQYTDERTFEEVPTGERKPFPRLALLYEGIVVDIEGLGRYRVWFNYMKYLNQDGYTKSNAEGELTLRLKPTTDPLTEPSKGTCKVGSRPDKDAWYVPVAFKGKPGSFLLSVDRNGPTTMSILLDIENGAIQHAWLERQNS